MDDGRHHNSAAGRASDYESVTRGQFAGVQACAGCHRDIFEKHILSSHYRTSSLPSNATIAGSFRPDSNRFSYDSGVVVKMEQRDSGFYQAAYKNGIETIARRFDLVFGSATKGQTYAYRNKDHLYQLPVSYLSMAKEWANSPKYPTHPLFDRPINSRCLECHATYAERTSMTDKGLEGFDIDGMILGVTCEKCHGPGLEHVNYQTAHPQDKEAKYIINPSHFTREQTLDFCSLCHGGQLVKVAPSFSFVAGDKLSNFFVADNMPPDTSRIDVHGNQAGLLRASKCFRMSQTMTCLSCHRLHENERTDLAAFSSRCMNCHNDGHGGVACKECMRQGSTALLNNCIDCHMPVKPSSIITALLPGETEPRSAMIRSHLIAIYPKAAGKNATIKSGL